MQIVNCMVKSQNKNQDTHWCSKGQECALTVALAIVTGIAGKGGVYDPRSSSQLLIHLQIDWSFIATLCIHRAFANMRNAYKGRRLGTSMYHQNLGIEAQTHSFHDFMTGSVEVHTFDKASEQITTLIIKQVEQQCVFKFPFSPFSFLQVHGVHWVH